MPADVEEEEGPALGSDVLVISLGVGLQIVIVGICAAMLLWVRSSLGDRARHAGHLAASFGFIGAVYAGFGVLTLLSGGRLDGEALRLWRVLASTLSLVSSTFLFTSWYLLRDQRLEERNGSVDPLPTMSKPFAANVLMALCGAIASYLGVAVLVGSDRFAQAVFIGVDVFAACAGCWFVGYELFQIKLCVDPGEGTLFRKAGHHSVFRGLAFFLFAVWGSLQFGVIPGLWDPKRTSAILSFPSGSLYVWLAIAKLLCAATATVLFMHSLPNAGKWRHRLFDRRPDRGPIRIVKPEALQVREP